MSNFNSRFEVKWNPKLRAAVVRAIAHATGKPPKQIPPMTDDALWSALRGLYKPPCRHGVRLVDVPSIWNLSDAEVTALLLGVSEDAPAPALPTGTDRESFFASMGLDVLDLERQLCELARKKGARSVPHAPYIGWYAPFIERLSPLGALWKLELADDEQLSAVQGMVRTMAALDPDELSPEDTEAWGWLRATFYASPELLNPA